jgi:heparan-sulfate lyase
MPDGGSYIYSGDRENRAWFRQTKVHQTLTLNGENSMYAPRLLLWKPGENLDILVVENQSYENLTHRRSLFFVNKRYFVIVDEATGTAAGEIDLHFQLAPGKAVADTENRAFQSAHESGWNVWVEAMGKKDLLLEEEEGQVSFLYTKKEPRPAYRFRTEKQAQTPFVRFVTVVAPYDREVPAIKALIKTALSGKTGEMEIEVTEAGKRFKIGYSL